MTRTQEESRDETDVSDKTVSDEASDNATATADTPEAEAQDRKDSAKDPEAGVGEDGSPGRDPDKPMTDTQHTYLDPLAASQDVEVRDDMNEAEASSEIDQLQDNAVHVY